VPKAALLPRAFYQQDLKFGFSRRRCRDKTSRIIESARTTATNVTYTDSNDKICFRVNESRPLSFKFDDDVKDARIIQLNPIRGGMTAFVIGAVDGPDSEAVYAGAKMCHAKPQSVAISAIAASITVESTKVEYWDRFVHGSI